MQIDADRFEGGVGIWGCLAAVYDTTNLGSEVGVHLHARRDSQAQKLIDGTFPAIEVTLGEKSRLIESEQALSFTISNVFGISSACIACTKCGFEHVDSDWFAVNPHKKHECNRCGSDFFTPTPRIGNPLADLQEGRSPAWNRNTTPSKKSIDIKQEDWPGGIQVWGTNPAILWTSPRPEEEGIHVHLYDEPDLPYGAERVDETFGEVSIDDVALDAQEVRILMVQNHLTFLQGRIVSAVCPECGSEHFDEGMNAFVPHTSHLCKYCGCEFRALQSKKKTVSNPMKGAFARLAARSPRAAKPATRKG